jgi:uncharacterized surface protein with fasciclin (FAS1) repeats
MRWFWLSTLYSAFAAPVPNSIDVPALASAIAGFKSEEGYTYELIRTALIAESASLQSLNFTNQDQLSVFVPADVSVSRLPFSTFLDKKALWEFVSYHIVSNATISPVLNQSIPYTTLLQEDFKLNGTQTGAYVVSALETPSKIVGNTTVGNITLYFVDNVFTVPLTIKDTLDAYRFETLYTLLDEFAGNATVANGTSFTFLVPTEKSLKDFIKETCKNFRDITVEAALAILRLHIIPDVKIYSSAIDRLFSANISTFQTASNHTLRLSKVNGTVSISGPHNNVTVLGVDSLVRRGVAHLISDPLLPTTGTICDQEIKTRPQGPQRTRRPNPNRFE